MVKCPVFNHFCCCCPLKVVITICIINNINYLKVGALIIGLVYLISGLIGGLTFTIAAATIKPETLEDMDGVVKISEDQV